MSCGRGFAPGAARRRRSATTPAVSGAPSSGRARSCAHASARRSGRCTATSGSSGCGGPRPTAPGAEGGTGGAAYGYLIYPHRAIIAYLAQTHRLLSEYCVTFPDQTRPYGSSRLPDSDDVLAKWMALTGDETRLISTANMHLPGRQLDPAHVKRDLWRLSQWERGRMRAVARRGEGPVDPTQGPSETPLDTAGQ